MATPERQEDVSYRPIDNQNLSAEVAYNPKRRKTTAELMQEFSQTYIPKPTVDEAKLDRIRRMGKINELNRGMSVLGDALRVGLGAPVRLRQPDTTAPALYQSYQSTLDKYKDDIDNYDYKKFQKRLQDIQLGIQRNDKDEAMDFAKEKNKALNELQAAKLNNDWNRYLEGLKLKKDAQDATNKYRDKRLGLDAEKLKLQKEKQDAAAYKPFDPIQVKDKTGNNVKLAQGDWDNLYQEAMKDKEFTKNFFPALKAQFESVPDVLLKQTARAYYDYKKNREVKASEQESLSRERKNRGLSNSAADDIKGSKPKKQIDYSTLKF